jgi:hypothetical protein
MGDRETEFLEQTLGLAAAEQKLGFSKWHHFKPLLATLG